MTLLFRIFLYTVCMIGCILIFSISRFLVEHYPVAWWTISVILLVGFMLYSGWLFLWWRKH